MVIKPFAYDAVNPKLAQLRQLSKSPGWSLTISTVARFMLVESGSLMVMAVSMGAATPPSVKVDTVLTLLPRLGASFTAVTVNDVVSSALLALAVSRTITRMVRVSVDGLSRLLEKRTDSSTVS